MDTATEVEEPVLTDNPFYDWAKQAAEGLEIADEAKLPQDATERANQILKALIEMKSTDTWFKPTGRQEFQKTYGFDYPYITSYEQEVHSNPDRWAD